MSNQLPSIGNPASTTKTLRAALEVSNGDLAKAVQALKASRATYAKNAVRVLENRIHNQKRLGKTLDGTWSMCKMGGVSVGIAAPAPEGFVPTGSPSWYPGMVRK